MKRRTFIKGIVAGIAGIALPATNALAAGNKYLIFWVNETMSTANKLKVSDKIDDEFPSVSEIKFGDLPRWRVVANPSKIGRTLCIDMARWSHKWTAEQARTWCNNNLGSDASKIQWAAGDDPSQTLMDEGLEPVPDSGPTQ